MDAQIVVTGRTESGRIAITASAKLDVLGAQDEIGRVFNGGTITHVAYSVDGATVSVVGDSKNWTLDFGNNVTVTHPRSGTRRSGKYAKDDLSVKPASRDLGPDIESLTSRVLKQFKVEIVAVDPKVQALEQAVKAREEQIARMLELLASKLSPEELAQITGK